MAFGSRAIHGLKGKAYIETFDENGDLADDEALVLEVGNVSLRINNSPVPVTNRTSSEDETTGVIHGEDIHGELRWEGTMDINHIPDDADQATIRSACLGQRYLNLRLVSKVQAGLPQWTGRILIADLGLEMPTNAQTLERVSFRGAGILSEGVQATGA